MKLTIDTENKTIEIEEYIDILKFQEEIEQFFYNRSKEGWKIKSGGGITYIPYYPATPYNPTNPWLTIPYYTITTSSTNETN